MPMPAAISFLHRPRSAGWSSTCAGRNTAGSSSSCRDGCDDNRRTHERSWEFELQPDESLPTLISEYQAQCEESRRIAAQYPLDHELWHGRLKTTVSLRWIYVHMIQEIARHTGQLDILREQLDGAAGFDG